MKIAIFTDTYTPDINGVVSSITILQQELLNHGHEVFIVTTHNKLQTIFTDHILALPGIELKRLYGYVLASPLHFKATEIIEKWDLDLIHAHTEFGIGIYARLVARKLKLPLVATYHTAYEDYTHYVNIFNSQVFEKFARKTVANLSRLYSESTTEIIAPSLKTKNMLQNYGIIRPISVIPTGLILIQFDPQKRDVNQLDQLKAELGLTNELVMVFVGRIALEKSIDVLIQALLELKQRGALVKLVIVGDGPELDNLKQLAKQLDLSNEVIFTGKKERTLVPVYYHLADVFASASTTETQGMTYIEALAAGLPIFARQDEAVMKLLAEGENGYYFDNAIELADKIQLYETLTPEKKIAMKQQALTSVKPYNSELFYSQVKEVYERVVKVYQEFYEITGVKSKGDLIEVTFNRNQIESQLILSVDLFAQFGLRKGKQINQFDYELLQAEEDYVLAYQQFLRRISAKDRTRKEMYDWLTQKTNLSIERINQMVSEFEAKNYINDERLTFSYVNKMLNLLQGQRRITQDLIQRGIRLEMIQAAFDNAPEYVELTNAIKYADKVMGTIKDKSLRKKKQLLANRLYRQGYNQEVIEDALANLNFLNDEQKELDILRKAAEKLHKKHEKRLVGSELRNQVFKGLIQAGFEYNDIYFVIDEMEW